MYELYGTQSCPYTREMREDLEWKGTEFVEYDVETDAVALSRLRETAEGALGVPVLVRDGRVIERGWRGRTCMV